MSARELLDRLERAGLRLSADGDRLRYRGPADVLDAGTLDALRASKTELLRILTTAREYPLSWAQRALWFVHQADSSNVAYHVAFSVRARSELDASRVERCLRELVARHPILRTTYALRDGDPVQIVHPALGLDWAVVPTHGEPLESVRERATRACEAKFDLVNGPILRAHLFVRAPDDQVLLLAAPHIAMDGWSVWQIVDELRRLYAADASGAEDPLEPITFRYADYVAWQEELLAGPDGARLAGFWDARIGGSPPRLDLPTDRPRPRVFRFAGDVLPFGLGTGLSERARAFARERGVTLHALFLAAYHALLHRYTRQERILVGSPTTGRTRPEFAQVIGCFVNSVTLSADFSGDPTFDALLAATRADAMAALEHQDYPLALITRRLGMRDASRAGLFEVDFVLQKPQRSSDIVRMLTGDGAERIDFAGVTMEAFPIPQQAGQVDLTLELIDGADEIVGNLKYHADLFERDTIERFAAHYRTLLDAALREPTCRVSRLPLFTPAGLGEWLSRARGPSLEVPEETLSDRVRAWCAVDPDAPALVQPAPAPGEASPVRLTRAQFAAAADRIAAAVREQAPGGGLVAVCCTPSYRGVVAVLGAWRAGCSVLPIDAAQPSDRIARILAEANPLAVICETATRDRFSGLPALVWEEIDPLAHDAAPPALDGVRVASPADPAYVLFTSGSTGTPKGVVVTHRNLVNALVGWERDYALVEDDVHLQMANPAFDVWMGDLARALGTGASLVICPREWLLDAPRMRDLIARERITVAEFVPAVLRTLRDDPAAENQRLSHLRLVACGGDRWYRHETEGFRRLLPAGCRLINSYGVTEATIDSSWFEVTDLEDVSGERQVPIGRPFANVSLYVLDQRQQPVPDGVIGELCIAGEGVSRGYLDARLTAERFVVDPFATGPDRRMYRTGDLARRRPDGVIELVGRTDDQVKIRGNRVELGEIEARTADHPDVRAAVAVIQGAGTDGVLGAFVVPAEGAHVDADAMREFLRGRLPAWMVPSVIRSIERIPLSPNGKVDRSALPPLDPNAAAASLDATPPRTATEMVLARLWAEVLDVPEVGIHADFFALGGHSLLAVRLNWLIAGQLHVELPSNVIFEAPTIAELARRIDALGTARPPEVAQVSAARPEPRTEAPLTWAQERVWLFQALEMKATTYNLSPVVRITGPLDRDRLVEALRAIVRRHAVLRTLFVHTPAGPRQRVLDHVDPAFTIEDVTTMPVDARAAACAAILERERSRPFRLTEEPPFRAVLVRRDAERHDLITSFHHIAADGQSLRIFYADLLRAYDGAPLDPLPISFADHAASERENRAWRDRGIDYWRERLEDAPPFLDLPADRPRPARPSYRGGLATRSFDAAVGRALDTLLKGESATLFNALLAAWAAALHRHSGARDIVIGSAVDGRASRDVRDMVGMFVNTLAMRMRVPPEATFRSLLRVAREVARGGFAHQDVPFAAVIEALNPPRDESRSPIFQVLLNVLPPVYGAHTAEAGGVRFEAPPAAELNAMFDGQAKFDLTLYGRQDRGLHLDLVYNRDLYNEERMAALLDDVVAILEAGAAAPDRDLAELWEEGAQHGGAGEPDRPVSEPPAHADPIEAFVAVAEEHPGALALVDAQRSLTYAELQAEALAVARHIRASVADDASPVGVLVPHDNRAATAILGVLAAGHPYVPLDLRFPRERLRFMADDAGLAAIVTTPVLESVARDISASQIITLDGAAAAEPRNANHEQADPSSTSEPRPDRPDALAYLLYTSGSTGTPKAVRQTRANLLVQARRYAQAIDLGPGDRVALTASISFDASLMDLFGGLLSGATVCVVDLYESGPVALPEIAATRGITVLHTTPSVFRTLIRARPCARMPEPVRMLVLGGEPVRASDIEAFDRTFTEGAALYDLYGSAEHSFALGGVLERDLHRRTIEVPVGRPVGDVECVLLDEDGQLDPVRGELAIRSLHGVPGYWNRPEQDARAFIADPRDPTSRLYRTGDVLRRRPDGAYVFLHRVDQQVKVRGQRVEPAEVEAVLSGLEGVAECAVHAVPDADGDLELTACIVARAGHALDTATLSAWCRERLPDALVPRGWVFLDRLPRTETGKLDRRALPAAERTGPTAAVTPPRNAEEEAIAQIWADVLGVERIGVDDDFFVLGGHSLAAARVTARIRDVFDVELPLRHFFDAPTVAACAEAVREMRSGGRPSPIPRRSETSAPLSPAQQRIWLFQQLEPSATTYMFSPVVRLEGPLDTERLEAALKAVVARHEPLRSRFVEREGEVVQVVDPVPERILEVPDASATLDLPAFDLAREIPFRARLVARADGAHDLITTFHHIAVDGSSLPLFYRDLLAAYAGASLSPLTVPYGDVAAWEHERWSDGDAGEGLAWWRDRLTGAPPVLELPVDRRRAATQSFNGGMLRLRLDPKRLAGIRDLVVNERATLFMALLAAWSAALHRQSGQRDLVIGTPVSGRDRTELFDMVGMLVNQLPLRMRVARGATLRSLLRDAREVALAGFAHQDVPFPLLVEAIDPPRDLSRTPIFQVMLNMLPPLSDENAWQAGDLRLLAPPADEIRRQLDVQSKFDMTLYGREQGRALELALVYNRDLYNEERIAALLDDVVAILEAGTAAPDRDIADLWEEGAQHAGAGEPDRLVSEPPAYADPVQAFVAVAEEHPDALALVDARRSLTYAALHAEAMTVARRIRSAVEDDASPVGVLVPHDNRAATAILGVLAAGHPYVPLDARFPRERLRFMAGDAGVAAIVTTSALEAVARDISGTEIITLDGAGERAGSSDIAACEADRPDAHAYLLYTSGSTGTPKAVRQTRANLLVQARRYAHAIDLGRGDRVALTASISFDASLMDLFGGLLSGATVCVVDLYESGPVGLPEIAATRGITVLHTTPSVFRTLIRARPDARMPQPVRMLVLGGEPVRASDIEAFDRTFTEGAALYDLYGSAEHSFALGGVLERDLHRRTIEVPIGRPVGDVECVLLDEDGHPDPVRGELAIRSAHGAPGYWNRPEQDARAFIADPRDPAVRLYRTGDVMRRRPDGAFVFLHRVDQQVKVRGQRVEPGEVEAVLSRLEGVAECAVHAVPDADGDLELTACIVARAGHALDAAALSAWCRERLPDALVPRGWVFLDRLPRTETGKLDRRALPAADRTAPTVAATPPRNAEEEAIAQIWAEVLDLDVGRLGAFDSFFDLGGHSLAAARVAARVRDVFDIELPLRHFFDTPTIAACSDWVRDHRDVHRSTLPPLRRGMANGAAPLSFSQERMWFLQELSPEDTAYNMGRAVRLRGPLDADRFVDAVRRLVERHEVLRTRIESDGGRPSQFVEPEPIRGVNVVDLRELSEPDRTAEALRIAESTINSPYDLTRDAPLRVSLIRIAEDDHVVAIGVHHAAADLWSLGIIAGEIATLYGDGVRGAALPRPAIGYRDFAAWQRAWFDSGAIQPQVEYWRERLRGVKPIELPTDFPRPRFAGFRGDTIRSDLPAELIHDLNRIAREERATLFMTLFAAFNATLAAWTRQTDIVVGVPIANRTHASLERMVGTFVNTLVHRNDLSGDPDFRALVRRVRATALEAFANQDAPFELLVRELQPDRDTSRSPLFQVLFNLANTPDGAVPLDGIVVEPFPLHKGTAQFELSMGVTVHELGSTVQLTWGTDLFTRATAERILAHFLEVLRRVAAEPDVPLSALRSPTPAEAARLLAAGRGREMALPDADLLALVTARAAISPDAIAVSAADGVYTYAELMRRVNAIARRLADLGVRPGDRVAVMLGRGRDTVSALLAIHAAGAAWVPIDPAYPADRVRYMLEDSAAAALIVDVEPTGMDPATFRALDLRTVTESGEGAAPRPPNAPHAAAYMIYTSGSTGRPKGVVVPHRALVNFLLSMRDEPGMSFDDVLLAVTTISFDIAVLELFLPLITGARVVIADITAITDGRTLAGEIDHWNVTVMQATPATWKLLLAAGWAGPRDGRPLRALCGGEALGADLAAELRARTAELWNMYGPTETTVWSTVRRIDDERVDIGRPIANTVVRVLDESGRRVPFGVPGELWIGGAGIALGYHDRPELTAERFRTDPFAEAGRLYRTGDLVRMREDGVLEHLGRLDHQVKVRGYRVEPGEVENALRARDDVADAVVIAHDDRLIAWIVPGSDDVPPPQELRTWLARSLPSWMVPSYFISLDELPLTPNGKLDRARLPMPDVRTDARTDAPAPFSSAERMIAKIWCELLDTQRVAATDNFFEIGGHSLLAMQVVSRIEERTGTRIDPRQLFFRTLAELAATLDVEVMA